MMPLPFSPSAASPFSGCCNEETEEWRRRGQFPPVRPPPRLLVPFCLVILGMSVLIYANFADNVATEARQVASSSFAETSIGTVKVDAHVSEQAEHDPARNFDQAKYPKILPNGMLFDPAVIPPLHDFGCEDAYNWTNGNAACSSDADFLGSIEAGLSRDAFCKPTGYTCAAYTLSGSCGTGRWPIGVAFNHPELNCCACGGGTTAKRLSADCGEATPECLRSVKWAMERGIHDHQDWYVGLSKNSSMEAFQLHLSRLPNAACRVPCGVNPTCRTTLKGEACYRHVTWAQEIGIYSRPDWYRGLSPTSRFEDFQRHVAKIHGPASQCSVPCTSALESGSAKSASGETIAGCPRRAYDGPKRGPSFCFAQLASNSGVQGNHTCRCPQGCNLSRVLIASSNTSVTFKNKLPSHVSSGACSKDVLLTSPREYFKHTADVKRKCGREGAIRQFEMLLQDAFDAFNQKACPSVIWQCFHSPQTASVPYLHLQTFVEKAFFHGMPTSNHEIAFCVRQRQRNEGRDLAIKLVDMM
eukprot:TRINITY_DN14846_c0_g1_i1.p1 TRINITY_DN14846_c0_g1~~TRINITY_DN14846_c0_g1_i1.p1  ORF type:complete len:528 (+),score=58.08 TRINITY_DN14846_c0_g1_i1:61-1644(+)